jgi:uncharacterized protein YjbK
VAKKLQELGIEIASIHLIGSLKTARAEKVGYTNFRLTQVVLEEFVFLHVLFLMNQLNGSRDY